MHKLHFRRQLQQQALFSRSTDAEIESASDSEVENSIQFASPTATTKSPARLHSICGLCLLAADNDNGQKYVDSAHKSIRAKLTLAHCSLFEGRGNKQPV